MLPTPHVRNLNANVYEPAEDSYLLLDCFEQEAPALGRRTCPIVCEIGAGSGIVTTFLQQNVFPSALFLATDISPAACGAVKATLAENNRLGAFLAADTIRTSLTLGLRRNVVDVLLFNPPYVPAESVPEMPHASDDDSWLDLALLGGSDGMVVTWQVLLALDDILAPGGTAYILFCARNNPLAVSQRMQALGWAVHEVITRKAGWEVLSVLSFTRESDAEGKSSSENTL